MSKDQYVIFDSDTVHEQIRIELKHPLYNDETGDERNYISVDVKLAEIIERLNYYDIMTENSCQNNNDEGSVLIIFTSFLDSERFMAQVIKAQGESKTAETLSVLINQFGSFEINWNSGFKFNASMQMSKAAVLGHTIFFRIPALLLASFRELFLKDFPIKEESVVE